MALLTCILCAASSAPRTFMCRVSKGQHERRLGTQKVVSVVVVFKEEN